MSEPATAPGSVQAPQTELAPERPAFEGAAQRAPASEQRSDGADESVDALPTVAPVPANMRRGHSGRDMFWSVAVLLVPILLIGGLLKACGSQDATVVDPSSAIADAQHAQLFDVLAPTGLADGWRVVSASFERDGDVGTLRLGYLSPAGDGAQLVESNAPSTDLFARELGDQVQPQGEVAIGGRSWTSSIVRDHERALVETTDAGTVIVVGQAGLDALTTLATSLR